MASIASQHDHAATYNDDLTLPPFPLSTVHPSLSPKLILQLQIIFGARDMFGEQHASPVVTLPFTVLGEFTEFGGPEYYLRADRARRRVDSFQIATFLLQERNPHNLLRRMPLLELFRLADVFARLRTPISAN